MNDVGVKRGSVVNLFFFRKFKHMDNCARDHGIYGTKLFFSFLGQLVGQPGGMVETRTDETRKKKPRDGSYWAELHDTGGWRIALLRHPLFQSNASWPHCFVLRLMPTRIYFSRGGP